MQPANPDHGKLHWSNGLSLQPMNHREKKGMEWEPEKYKTYKKTKL